nr:serine/arginine repetitive matrix protein 1-like isoform X2 [Dermacentor andersoni]
MTKASPSQGSDGKKPRPPWSTLSTRAAESRMPGWIPERDRREAGSSSGTKYKQSPVKSSSTKQRGDGGGVPPPSSRGADTRRPSWISERDWLEAGPSGVRQSPVKLGPGSRPAKTAEMQSRATSVTATVLGTPRRLCRTPTKQRGDGGGVPPPSSRSADTRRPSWISERDWQEAGPSGVRQSPVKKLGPGSRLAKTARMQSRATSVTATVSGIPRRLCRQSTKQRGDGGGVPSPSSSSADTRRPSWISERDWQEAGPSGVRQAPVKQLGPGSGPAKMARMQSRATALTATVSGIPPPRRRTEEGVSRQSPAPANLSPGDLEREDGAGGRSGAPMEVDHAKLLSSAFDEVMKAVSASIHMIASSCVATSDPDQQSGNDSSS